MSATEVASAPDLGTLDFRRVCANFVTGVTVVAATTPAGPHGATVNSFASLSAEPPQVIVCLARASRTWRAVEAAGRFAVNILASDQEHEARLFAAPSADRAYGTQWTVGRNGSPVLIGAAATIECSVISAAQHATHMLVIGAVTHGDIAPDASPLMFFRSALHGGPAAGLPVS